MKSKGLNVENLSTYYFLKKDIVKAVEGVNLSIKEGEFFALIGPSGCGKSTLGLSLLNLIQFPGKIISGRVFIDGIDILSLNKKQLCDVRGKKISIIFQDPFTSLNPVMTIYDQLIEGPIEHFRLSVREAEKLIYEVLKKVRIENPDIILPKYPHQLSGGQRQRIMIAMAISCGAKYIVADEPTTALDVTTQRQIIDLLVDLKIKDKLSVLFITHNLRLAEKFCDKIALMKEGKIIQRIR